MRQRGAGLLYQLNFTDAVHGGEFFPPHVVQAIAAKLMMWRAKRHGMEVIRPHLSHARSLVVNYGRRFSVAKVTTHSATQRGHGIKVSRFGLCVALRL